MDSPQHHTTDITANVAAPTCCSHPVAVATRALLDATNNAASGTADIQQLQQLVAALQQSFKGSSGDELEQAVAGGLIHQVVLYIGLLLLSCSSMQCIMSSRCIPTASRCECKRVCLSTTDSTLLTLHAYAGMRGWQMPLLW